MRLVLIAVMLAGAVSATAQTPPKAITPPRVEPATIKLPAERSAQLKSIQERQEKLAQEFQSLDAQKAVITLRAALEMKMTVEQLDQMELTREGDSFVFKPRPPAEKKP